VSVVCAALMISYFSNGFTSQQTTSNDRRLYDYIVLKASRASCKHSSGPSSHFIESGLPSFVKKCGRFFVRAMPCTSTHAHTVSAMHISFVRAITQRPAQTCVHTLRVQSTRILCGHARTCMHTHTHFECMHIELERACMHALRVQCIFIVREQCPAQARVHTN
jgi:hypothetical protein